MVIIDFKIAPTVVDISHQLLAQVIDEGDSVIDATAGNGNDTVFLARLVGESGTVWAFDIQQQAIENTRIKLKETGLLPRVQLVQGSHGEMDKYVTQMVSAVVFNLGYLPGGDKGIITCPDTTLPALNKSRDLLVPGGILCIVLYWGHQGGTEEKEAVEEWVGRLTPTDWDVLRISFPNRNTAPYVIAVQKKSLEAEVIMKASRQRKIQEIIGERDVETQYELTEELRKAGFEVTQATVSRDIKELGLVKVPAGFNHSKYSMPGKIPFVKRTKWMFSENITNMDYSENIIMIRTLPGAAQAVASCIDHLDWKDILGTVAGDDTIMVVVKPKEAVQTVLQRFYGLME